MTVKTAIVFILTNRDMYGERVTSPNMIKHIEELTGSTINDVALRDMVKNICLEDGLLIGGTQKGFMIAQNREEAREIHSWIAYRIEPLIKHSRHFEQIAIQKFHDFQQETLFDT